MKQLFHRKHKIKIFTWFRLSLLAVLLIAAGSLYTPYPAELVKVLTEKEKPVRKKKRKVVKPVVKAPEAPGTQPVASTPPAADAEDDIEVEPWAPQEAFSMPAITLPPFPPALPEKVEPGRYEHINSMTPGLNVFSSVMFEQGSTASQDRKAREAYQLRVSLNLRLPQAADGETLKLANPRLPDLFTRYADFMGKARVSQWFQAIYLHKQNRMRKEAATLSRLLDRHNYYDTDTILEIEAPDTGRKVLWVQADMDVVSDGSDGDRLPDMPAKVKNSDYYQPMTSYRWRKLGTTPNPLLPHWEERVRKLSKDKKANADSLQYAKNVVHDLKKYSFLLAEYDTFIVVPLTFKSGDNDAYRPQLGDYAAVVVEDRIFPAIVGDYGPRFKAGEGSLRLARLINPKATPFARPVSHLGVSYIIFPGSREPENAPINYERLNSRVQELLSEMGGITEHAKFQQVEDLLAPKPQPAPTQP
ncbi:MAG: glycoside hydrolase family 75 protein [Akkermansia sp.]|nr:glycoside hydrolase family 75 protein [Akkermansia sp.]MBR2313751.1 glycoside hydrolase family 75 protein [Akkermansia sp.]